MQKYWNGLSFLSPGDLPDSGTEPVSSALQAGSLLSEPPRKSLSSNGGLDEMDGGQGGQRS